MASNTDTTPSAMNWHLLELSPDQIKDMTARYGIPDQAAEVFLRRGITSPEDLRYYLETNVRSAHNPFLFNDMENVVERVQQAAAEGEKVLVFGDRDVDGITAATLVVRKLRELGLDPLWRLPQEDEPYGLSFVRVEEAAALEVTLIITVDCGITNLDEIDAAREAGIDVIVIDHHNPIDELPDAVGIINPKVEDSGYPFAGLCAGALAAKVCLALDFARTSLYGEEQCLLNIRPGNDSLVFEAVKLRNLVETARLCETIVSTNPAVINNRIVPFITGTPLFVYDRPTQLGFLKQMFGQGADIYVTDLAEETARTFPDLAGRSLLRMIPNSRLARFSTARPTEIDVLKSCALALFQSRIKAVYQAHERDLALVALSTVADMVPLRDENRILVRKGLESLQGQARGGLHALLADLGLLQPPVSLRDLSWKVCPVLNAAGRLGKPETALELLLSDDPSRAHSLVRSLVEMNETRRKHGEQAWGRMIGQARTAHSDSGGRFVLVRDDEIPRGITGILAGRFAREFDVPAMVVAAVDERLVGSIRSVRGFNATTFLSGLGDLLSDWGGHDAAGGFHLPRTGWDEFQARVSALAADLVLEPAAAPQHFIDVRVPLEAMDEQLWRVEELFSPAGQESPAVLYRCDGLLVRSVALMGKEQRHVRLTLSAGSRQWPAVWWDAVERVNRDFAADDRVDILFRLEKNTFNQNTTLQLNIVDLVRSPRAGR